VRARIALVLAAAGLLAGLGRVLPRDADAADQRLRAALGRAGVHAVAAPPREDPDLVALGSRLFQDTILSGNRNVSCASCHSEEKATVDGLALERARALAGGDRPGPRNVIALWNAGLPGVDRLFWDGRVARDPLTGALTTPSRRLPEAIRRELDGPLAAQALFPVISVVEMRGQPGSNEIANARDDVSAWGALVARLLADPSYRELFRAAFPRLERIEDVNFGHAARAIAAFERSAFTALETPFDRFLAGDDAALEERAKRGAELFFGKARCASCHGGPLLSDFELHALAVPQIGPGKSPGEDRGKGAITTHPQDDYMFRTPPLRNVALTGPYMHDGCFTTLEAAVRHHLDPVASYRAFDGSGLPVELARTVDRNPIRGAQRVAALDPILRDPVALSRDDVADVVGFLEALTDPRSRGPR
jgi:cytochrome c peroxidase